MALRSRPRLRGQSTSTPPRCSASTPSSRRLTRSSVVERQLVGDPLLEQALERRPGGGRLTQGQRGVGAGPVAEAVHGRRVVSTGAAASQTWRGSCSSCTWSTSRQDPATSSSSSASTRSERVTSWGRSAPSPRWRATRAWRRRLKASPSGRVWRGTGSCGLGVVGGAAGCGARHRVDDGVDQTAYDVLGIGRREPGVGPGLGQPAQPLGVVGVERGQPPHAVTRLELAGRHEPHREQRGRREQGHRRVRRLIGAGLGQHRQGGPDRQRDRAAAHPGLGELHEPVTGRLRGAQGRRTRTAARSSPTPPQRDDHLDASPPYRQRVGPDG